VDHLKSVLESFWETETISIKERSDAESIDASFFQDIQFVDNRYKVSLPWNREVPDQFGLCRNRLRHLQRRLKSQPTTMLEYHHTIKGHLRDRIIEPIPKQDDADTLSTVPCHITL